MAIKYCWATNRRGSSLKGVMKFKEIGHDPLTLVKAPDHCFLMIPRVSDEDGVPRGLPPDGR